MMEARTGLLLLLLGILLVLTLGGVRCQDASATSSTQAPPPARQCPAGCRGEKGKKGSEGWYGGRGPPGQPGERGTPGKYIIYTGSFVLPDGSEMAVTPALKEFMRGKQQVDIDSPQATGDPGEPGPVGLPGPDGRHGFDGPPGSHGNHGRTGIAGIPGDVGPPGTVGLQGVSGSPGSPGAEGDVGQPGARGPKGHQGHRGETGAHGPKGSIGARGLTGEPGEKGQKGIKGGIGSIGLRGDQGEKGQRGERGTTGGPGQKGEPGRTGEAGRDGRKGQKGRLGSQGENGIFGADGATGEFGPAIMKRLIAQAGQCEGNNRGKVHYDTQSSKVYFCNGLEWRCINAERCGKSCRVSPWHDWQTCSRTCGGGVRIRYRTILEAPGPYGHQCPPLNETQPCSENPCSCPRPRNILHGSLASSDRFFPIGTAAPWSCDTGYDVDGSRESLCRPTEEYHRLPTCQRVRCPDPGEPENGQRNGNPFARQYQGQYTFSCNEGYTLSGARSITCQANRTWSAARPTCNPISCGDPGTPDNSWRDGSVFTFGSKVSFVCNRGMVMSGHSEIMCLASGRWLPSLPTCNPVHCSDPGAPQNGARSGDDFMYSSNVTFQCIDGYALVGSSMRICLASGQWSGTQPFCNLRSCGVPTTPANGSRTGDSFDVGNVVEFSCDLGYILRGSPRLTCTAQGHWSHSTPLCQIVTCCRPDELANGVVIYSSRVYQSSVSYTCNSGFRLLGSATRQCQLDGTWTGVDPQCQPIYCPDPMAPANGGRQPAFSLFHVAATNQVSFSCNSGYELVGSQQSNCQADGTWSAALPSCRRIECPDPGTPANGMRSGDSLASGDTLTFSCNDGYTLVGSTSRTCQLDKTFNGTQPECQPDCKVSDWGPWGPCGATCGPSTQFRRRTITQPPGEFGARCPPVVGNQVCNEGTCNICMNRFSPGQSAYVTPSAGGPFAADVVLVIEQSQPLSQVVEEIRKHLSVVETTLQLRGIGSAGLLPNLYTIVGFGSKEEVTCGHFITDQAGNTALPFSTADNLLNEIKLGERADITDSYEAIEFGINNAQLRHGPNIAHNLILITNASRTEGCGNPAVTKQQVNTSLTNNGFTPNFVLDHRIVTGRDKQQEVLGVRGFSIDERRDLYLRQGTAFQVVSSKMPGVFIDYKEGQGTLNEDYSQLALDLDGVVWNVNQFVNRNVFSSSRRSFARAFTEIKALEMEQTAKACKLCTCEASGRMGIFRCRQQNNQLLCNCLANGNSIEACLATR